MIFSRPNRNPPVPSQLPNEQAPVHQRSADSEVYQPYSPPFGWPKHDVGNGPEPVVGPALGYDRQIIARPSRKFSSMGHIWHARPKFVLADTAIAQDTGSYLRSAAPELLVLQAIMPSDINWAFRTANDSLRNFARDRARNGPLQTLTWRNGNMFTHAKVNSSQGFFRAKNATVNEATLIAASMVDLGDVRAATRLMSRVPEYTVAEMVQRLDCGDILTGEDGERVMAQAIYRLTRRYISASPQPNGALYGAAVLAASSYLQHDDAVKALAAAPAISNPERVRMDRDAFNRSLGGPAGDGNNVVRAVNTLAFRIARRMVTVFNARQGLRHPRVVNDIATQHPRLTANEVDQEFQHQDATARQAFDFHSPAAAMAVILAGAMHCCDALKSAREKRIQAIGQAVSVVFAGLAFAPYAGAGAGILGTIAAVGFDRFKETTDMKGSLIQFVGDLRDSRAMHARRMANLTGQMTAMRSQAGFLAAAPAFMALQVQHDAAEEGASGHRQF